MIYTLLKTLLGTLFVVGVASAQPNAQGSSGAALGHGAQTVKETRANAEKGYFSRKEDGWFWYKDPPIVVPLEPEETPKEDDKRPEIEKIKEEDKAKTREPEAEKKVEAFSVEWLRTNLPVLLDRAIDNPTDENVSYYLYAQRIALDKAQNYAEKTRHVVANDPFLDENNRVPLATFAKKEFLHRAGEGQKSALDYLGTKAGIWMFFDSTCDFCHIQSRIVQSVAKEHHLHTMFISLNGKGMANLPEHYNDQGQAQSLGVKMTPTTVLVVPPSTYLIVSQGLMAEDQLKERLLVAADSHNLFPEEYKKEINLYNNGVLTTEELSEGADDDPAVWLKRLKEKISGKQF